MSSDCVTTKGVLFPFVHNVFCFSREMSSSASFQKSCIQIVFLITWTRCVSAGNDLRFWLGCRAVIHCQPPSFDSDSFKWFYKEDGPRKEIQLYFEDRSGVRRYGASRRRANITNNRSLVIDSFNEDDQGIYWCENCKEDICRKDQAGVFRVQKEILNETQKTFFITAGRTFTQTCSVEFPDLSWTFERSQTNQASDRRSETIIEMTNRSVHIASVKSTDAGRYTCWVKRCGGPSQKLLTVNLCVIKTHDDDDDSFSCAVTCNANLNKPKNISSLLMDNTKILLTVDPSGSLICNASQIFDGHTTVTSKYTTSTKAGESDRTKHLMPVLYGVPVVVTCLFITIFFIFCVRSRWRTAFPFCCSCCGFSNKEEVDSTVIYSSVVIKTPNDRRNHDTAESDCLYSEIQI